MIKQKRVQNRGNSERGDFFSEDGDKAASSDSDNVASEEEAEKAGFSMVLMKRVILLIQILKIKILQTAVQPVCFGYFKELTEFITQRLK